jgi:hypothetical protein
VGQRREKWDSTSDSRGTVAGQTAPVAVIAEHDGGILRVWTEAQARLSKCPPPDVSCRRWDQFRDDFARFCARWAGSAEALGWRPHDLLGWDPRYPYTPIAQRLGLTWKIEGAAVVAVTRESIVIDRRGARITLPRQLLM